MSNSIIAIGNLGAHPSTRFVDTKNGSKQITEFSIFCDEYSRDADGQLSQSDGCWMRVSVWEPKAEDCAKLLKKGCRVQVSGNLRVHTWKDEKGENQCTLQINAEHIGLQLGRIEAVSFKQKAETAAENQSLNSAVVN